MTYSEAQVTAVNEAIDKYRIDVTPQCVDACAGNQPQRSAEKEPVRLRRTEHVASHRALRPPPHA